MVTSEMSATSETAAWVVFSFVRSAAAVYAAALLTNEKTTQAAVSEVADISEVTIRNRYHELLEAEQGLPVA